MSERYAWIYRACMWCGRRHQADDHPQELAVYREPPGLWYVLGEGSAHQPEEVYVIRYVRIVDA